MDIKFNHTGHKALWNWLADHPGKSKEAYFVEKGIQNKDLPLCLCYACEYDCQDCVNCPLSGWGSMKDDFCWYSKDGLFYRWEQAMKYHNYITACKIARKIANLPVREGVECI